MAKQTVTMEPELTEAEVLAAKAAEAEGTDGQEQEPDTDTTSPMKDLTGIQYIGFADVKGMTAVDLANAGVADPKGDLQWDSQNDHTVGIKDVNASTLEYLRSQPDFRVF